MRGFVNDRLEAVVPLSIRSDAGTVLKIDALVDTGFSASLTLPLSVISRLNLIRQSTGTAMFADGVLRPFEIFEAEIEWDGIWRPILASAVGNDCLLGMRLLADHLITITASSGGSVEITLLP